MSESCAAEAVSARLGYERVSSSDREVLTMSERRPSGERPRDELGRPLAWDAENKIVPDDNAGMTLEENHQLGIEHFNAGRVFQAHEAWEAAWNSAKDSDDEEFFKGFAQLGAGYTHMARGNARGAQILCRRFMDRASNYAQCHQGIDVALLVRAVLDHANEFGAAENEGQPPPQVAPPQIRPC